MSDVWVDGSIFSFPAGWEVEKFDEWPGYRKVAKHPLNAKGCDLIAINAERAWLIEVKDYTYLDARIPGDLSAQVGRKYFDTLATVHALANWDRGDHGDFSRKFLKCETVKASLVIELPDGGRRFDALNPALMGIYDDLKRVTKKIGITNPVISNSYVAGSVPWGIRRDPDTRERHIDR